MARVAIIMGVVVVLGIIVIQFAPLADSPEQIFEDVWQDFDEHYALFEVRGVDWRALGDEYGPAINSDTSDEELFDVLTAMLSHLDDDQVVLRAPSLDRDFSAGDLGPLVADLGMDGALEALARHPLILDDFLGGPRLADGGRLQYGWLADHVGYLHLTVFADERATVAAVDSVLSVMTGARAWIVDVRSSGGDDDRTARAVADRFADRRRLYMISRARSGPGHDDFAGPRYWHVDRVGRAFAGPVALLTDRRSRGAAETFALAMRTLPNVTVVGDTTSGSLADARWFNLHNGWRVSLSRNRVDDHADRCWEGIGVPPDVVVAAAAAGDDDDPILVEALRLLEGAGPPLQDESASAAAARYDLVEILEELLEDGEFPAVGQEFDRIRSEANPEHCRVDRNEINALGYRMLRDDRFDDAVGVFEIYVDLKPDDANAHDSLGEAYLERGDTELAIASYERSLELDPGNRNAERMLRRLR